ncbi:MAG: GTP 3',8-cyclase MoaA [Saprospiraceae bacterium]|nr:GTP 3',8-cyclase MoaA [Saprospiraceae bacterium]MCB0676424.1 GTP 3',8-cyclase MoaA [Saprospiraceae bacterium]
MLYDNHGRQISYLRLAVTDRCNLRCFYCMPEEGIRYVDREDLMSYEEMERIARLLAPLGVDKLRITGGEPFVRKDILEFFERLSRIEGLKKINLTTNGTLTAGHVQDLQRLGIHSVNLSLDTLDRERFLQITRRDAFDKVMTTLDELLGHGIPTKINAVVMEGKNIDDLVPMVELTRRHPVDVRFIEEMPFNGQGAHYAHLAWDHRRILAHLQEHFPAIAKVPDPPFSTSRNYRVPGFLGSVGIIAAYSRTFCGSCNRIRITPQGMLKTCLYDDGVFNVRDLIRHGASDEQLRAAFLDALANRARDGFEAENRRRPVQESMSTIGG